jgi:hypothetical protein
MKTIIIILLFATFSDVSAQHKQKQVDESILVLEAISGNLEGTFLRSLKGSKNTIALIVAGNPKSTLKRKGERA